MPLRRVGLFSLCRKPGKKERQGFIPFGEAAILAAHVMNTRGFYTLFPTRFPRYTLIVFAGLFSYFKIIRHDKQKKHTC